MAGLTADQIRDSRLGTSVDPKTDALIRFALRVLDARGAVGEADLDEVRGAGFDDAAIAEVVANVALPRLHQLLQPDGRDRPRLPRSPGLEAGDRDNELMQAGPYQGERAIALINSARYLESRQPTGRRGERDP